MKQTPFDADFVVVGSGPAGLSASIPLLEAGRSVLMIDGAGAGERVGDFAAVPQWSRALGPRLEGLLPEDGLSPKLRTPLLKQLIAEFQESTHIRGENFFPVGALSRGGLSQFWGGFACEYDAADIADWPISIGDMRTSYRAVTNRIGISGSSTDDMADILGASGELLPPPPLGRSTSRVLQNYQSAGSRNPDFVLGLARNALLTQDLGYRKACDLRYGCLWGCPRGSIYDSRYELLNLQKNARFVLVDNALAVRMAPIQGGWSLITRDGRTFRAPRIVLAAGTLATTRLALSLLQQPPSELRLLSNPSLAVPLFVPREFRKLPPAQGHSLAHLSFRLRCGREPGNYVMGSVYEMVSLPLSLLIARAPLSRRAGTDFFAALAPALLMAGCFFPGSYSNHRIRLSPQAGDTSLVIHGALTSDLAEHLKQVKRTLFRAWRRLGAWMLPAASVAHLGTDVHYCGTFPMGNNSVTGTDAFGELHAARGVFVVDGAALPTLPAKSLTLTIMANADRIGRYLSKTGTASIDN